MISRMISSLDHPCPNDISLFSLEQESLTSTNYVRQRYLHLNTDHSIIISLTFPSKTSLLRNIHLYNDDLKELSVQIGVKTINLNIDNHHISIDNIHIDRRFRHRIYNRIKHEFDKYSEHLQATE